MGEDSQSKPRVTSSRRSVKEGALRQKLKLQAKVKQNKFGKIKPSSKEQARFCQYFGNNIVNPQKGESGPEVPEDQLTEPERGDSHI